MAVSHPVLRQVSRALHSFAQASGPEWDAESIAARAAQELLSCPPLPASPDLEVALWSEPAHALSGDFYDVVPLDANRIALLVGDVSGKGAAAALIAASLQASLQTHLNLDYDICQALHAVNCYLVQRTAPNHFATLFVGIYDSRSRNLRYVNAGHNSPILLRHTGEIERLGATATIVGAFCNWECGSETIRLEPQDLLLAFTDGVTESRDRRQQEFGESRLVQELRRHRDTPLLEVVKVIIGACGRFRNGERQDDITLVAARIPGGRRSA